MNFKNIINVRLIAIHLTATFFILLASRELVGLTDIEMLQTAENLGVYEGLKDLSKEEDFAPRLGFFLYWTSISPLIGLLISFFISLGLTVRKKKFWVSSLIVLLVIIFLNRSGVFDNRIIREIFFALGNWCSRFGLIYKFIVNGLVLSFIGLLLFFSQRTNKFIFDDIIE